MPVFLYSGTLVNIFDSLTSGLGSFSQFFEKMADGLFAWFAGVVSFFMTVPELFSGLPLPVQALLTFGVSGILVGIILRII